ncbi:MAG: hypothetical protein KAV41_00960 [Candidatus Pacebacteria bacterium]|nr:hypothetical protein [Candidatus Paceibacterota bacterium]
MIFLISTTILSFLILVALLFLKWRELKSEKIRARSDILKRCDNYLEKYFLIIKAKTRKIQNDIPPLAYFSQILSRLTLKFWHKSIDVLVNFLLKIRKSAEKINTDQQQNSVSPYLRDISNDKDNSN